MAASSPCDCDAEYLRFIEYLWLVKNPETTLGTNQVTTDHDAANEMLALDAKSFSYDNNGNLQNRTDTCGSTSYTWDARNRLTNISGYKPDCSALTASFSYDALNRRTAKTINGTTTQYVYDGWDIIQEIKGGVKTNYIRTLNIDEPLTRITGSTVRHYVADALGSIVALADDSGVTKTSYVYDAFGNVTTSGEASDNPFQYTGRENDGTGLLHYRYRYYSPQMQRFVSEDPIGLAGGVNFYSYVDSVGKPQTNLYAYTDNNPVNFTDPQGLSPVNGAVGAGGFLSFANLYLSSDSGFAGDTNGKFCFYTTTCYGVGVNTPGGGLGANGQLGTGALKSGCQEQKGAYWFGGDGAFGQGQVLTGSGDYQYGRGIPNTKNIKFGVGGGGGAGYLSCKTNYYCF